MVGIIILSVIFIAGIVWIGYDLLSKFINKRTFKEYEKEYKVLLFLVLVSGLCDKIYRIIEHF